MSKVWGSMPSAFKKGNRAVTKVPSQQSEFQRASAPTRQWCSVWRGAVSPGSTGDWKTQLQWGRQCRGGPDRGTSSRLPAAHSIKMHMDLRAVVTDSHLGLCSTAPGERQGGGATLWQSLCNVTKPPRTTPGVQGTLTISCFWAWAGVLSKGPAE